MTSGYQRSVTPEFAYTVGTGCLYMDMAQFHEDAEALLERPILTHEFADRQTWDDMKVVLEARFTELAEAKSGL